MIGRGEVAIDFIVPLSAFLRADIFCSRNIGQLHDATIDRLAGNSREQQCEGAGDQCQGANQGGGAGRSIVMVRIGHLSSNLFCQFLEHHLIGSIEQIDSIGAVVNAKTSFINYKVEIESRLLDGRWYERLFGSGRSWTRSRERPGMRIFPGASTIFLQNGSCFECSPKIERRFIALNLVGYGIGSK